MSKIFPQNQYYECQNTAQFLPEFAALLLGHSLFLPDFHIKLQTNKFKNIFFPYSSNLDMSFHVLPIYKSGDLFRERELIVDL